MYVKGAFIIYGEGGGFGKIDRRKKKPPPLANTWEKNRPPHDTVGKFLPPSPPPHVLKTCLYVAVVLPQQL